MLELGRPAGSTDPIEPTELEAIIALMVDGSARYSWYMDVGPDASGVPASAPGRPSSLRCISTARDDEPESIHTSSVSVDLPIASAPSHGCICICERQSIRRYERGR